jgi:predicted branched-subunit amino acid permease
MPDTSRSFFLAGIRAELPIVLGVLPFGLIYGVLAVSAGMSPALSVASSVIVFAGAPALVIWATTFIVNLRHLLYSAALAPYAAHLPRRWQLLLGYLLTDEAYVVTAVHYESEQGSPLENQHWFWLGAGLTLWVSWQLSTITGVLFGTQVPESWSLDFTLALTFIGMVVPLCRYHPNLAAAMVAGAVGVLTNAWPYRLGLMAAALSGIAAGVLMERRTESEIDPA